MKNYSLAMETFLFRKSWGELFQALPDKEAGALIKAVYAHVNGESPKLEGTTIRSIYKTITKEIDISAYKYLLRAGYIDDEEE